MITNWRKATFSADNSACVETGWTATTVGYRDGKHVGPILIFPKAAAHTFLTRLVQGYVGGP